MKIRKPLTFPRQPIQVRRPSFLRPVAPQIAVTQVIRQDDDDIRTTFRRERVCSGANAEESEPRESLHGKNHLKQKAVGNAAPLCAMEARKSIGAAANHAAKNMSSAAT
jgi:hypothetical protein